MFFKRKKSNSKEIVDEQSAKQESNIAGESSSEAQPEPTKKPSFFERIKSGLARTGKPLSEGISNLFLGKKTIDDELFEELETCLLYTSDAADD